jgi:hypothetical protein
MIPNNLSAGLLPESFPLRHSSIISCFDVTSSAILTELQITSNTEMFIKLWRARRIVGGEEDVFSVGPTEGKREADETIHGRIILHLNIKE